MTRTAVAAGDPDDEFNEPDWLSTAEAAKQLGITTRTLYRLIDEGVLRAFRFGRVIRIRRADVDDARGWVRDPTPQVTTSPQRDQSNRRPAVLVMAALILVVVAASVATPFTDNRLVEGVRAAAIAAAAPIALLLALLPRSSQQKRFS